MGEIQLPKQGVLYRCRAYTIGAMQYADGRGWRNYVKSRLEPRGLIVFDPYHKPFINEIREDEEARVDMHEEMESGDYEPVVERMKMVRTDDLRLCDISDLLIANINPKVASWGSAEEIFTSNRMKKPIFMAVEGGKKNTPVWLMATFPHKYIYDSIEEVVETIERIDDGIKAIDNERWKLLKPEYR